MSTYHIFEAARRLRLRNIVWASSETLLGLPFDEPPPHLPVDEDYTARPQSGYSLSKFVCEEIAKQFCRWDPELKIVGLRFSNVMEPSDYAAFPGFDKNPASEGSTFGAKSTLVMEPKRFASRSKRRSRALTSSSLRMRTLS